MRVFLTGASGVIGRRVVPLLIAAGHGVTAIGRTIEKRTALTRAGAEAVDVDLFDLGQLRRAVIGHEAIVNLATHMPPSSVRMMLPWEWRENDHVRRDGSAKLVDAAIAEGVPRFVQESFGLVYPDRGDEWTGEAVPLQPVSYNRTVLDAERSVARFTASGRSGIVLRFAGFYGPDAFTMHDMADMVRRGWSPIPGRPSAFVSSISHDDAASAVVASLGVLAGAYNVCDDEPVRRREYVDIIASTLNVSSPRFLPPWTAKLMGSVGALLSRSERMSNGKLRAADPTWAPRFPSVREGLPAAIRGS
jgi:nucleoside-diphosphate-sugar epimerase